jgi:HSP20 family molecular chaperone IbpA
MDLVDDPTASRIVALFELPGIKSSDISLQIQEGHLVVFGTRSPPTLDSLKREFGSDSKSIKPQDEDVDMKLGVSESEAVKVPVQELRYGSFYRAIRIPGDIQESDVTATLLEGMLKVTWPRVAGPHAPVNPTTLTPSISTASPTPGRPASPKSVSQ